MPHIAIQTDPQPDETQTLQTEIRDLKTTAADQSIEADRAHAKYHRWRGIAGQLTAEIEELIEINRAQTNAYLVTLQREHMLRAEITRLKLEVVKKSALIESLQAHVPSTHAAQTRLPAKAAAFKDIAGRHYQSLNPHKFNKPAVTTTMEPPNKPRRHPTAPAGTRFGKK